MSRFLSHVLFSLLFAWTSLAWTQPLAGSASLQAYTQLQAQSTELPFLINSNEQERLLTTEIYSVLDQPLEVVSDSLGNLANWCEFIPLNFNIKACTYSQQNDQKQLTLYLGRKHYQTPEESHSLSYRFHSQHSADGSFNVSMRAKEGPMGTSNYTIDVHAIAVEEKTLVHVNIGYRNSWYSDLASSIYFATLGRGKLGFSREGEGYIHGSQAVLERNAMRYYLAVKAFLEAEALPPEQRFEARIKRWYQMTEAYPKQLYELEQQEYLQAKRQEREHQTRLQTRLTQ